MMRRAATRIVKLRSPFWDERMRTGVLVRSSRVRVWAKSASDWPTVLKAALLVLCWRGRSGGEAAMAAGDADVKSSVLGVGSARER